MQDLPLVALRALAAVYAHRGVRAAARELGIAHSSVSRHLAELERWLGVSLTQPAAGPRDFALTPQGERLGEVALTSVRALALAAASVLEAKSPRSVTLSTTPSFAARWLLPRLATLETKQRSAEVSVVVDQKLDDLHAGDIDLAIRMGLGPWPGLHCEPLMDDSLYPVLSRPLFEKARRPHSPKQLVGLPLLHDRDPQAAWAIWRDTHGPRELDVRSGRRFASSDLILRAAALSQGVGLARHRLVADDVKTGTLIRPFGDLAVTLADAYWIVMPSRSLGRTNVIAFVAWLKHQAEADEVPAANRTTRLGAT